MINVNFGTLNIEYKTLFYPLAKTAVWSYNIKDDR